MKTNNEPSEMNCEFFFLFTDQMGEEIGGGGVE